MASAYTLSEGLVEGLRDCIGRTASPPAEAPTQPGTLPQAATPTSKAQYFVLTEDLLPGRGASAVCIEPTLNGGPTFGNATRTVEAQGKLRGGDATVYDALLLGSPVIVDGSIVTAIAPAIETSMPSQKPSACGIHTMPAQPEKAPTSALLKQSPSTK